MNERVEFVSGKTGFTPGSFLLVRTVMNKFILGKKLGMTQVVNERGEIIPVTLIGVEEMAIIQVKTIAKDGYTSVQIGGGSKKEKLITKPMKGHLKNLGHFRHLKEFKPADVSKYTAGDKVSLADFLPGEKVTVSSKSTGRGFQGVVRRHGFSGGPASHGHRDVLRKPGSIGGRFPQRVLKGKRMAGRMGYDRVTVKNLKVIRVDAERGVLALRGAVPGRKGTMVEIKN